jgi:TolB-like protein/class 3 adenylate cyclase/Tfp pilus assembly protein PilF
MVVEFEPHSLWYETSLTIAAHALRNGARTDYHTFQHIPSEVLGALARFGLDVKKLEGEGSFRLLDTYTGTTGIGVPEKPKVGRQPYQTQYPVLSNWNISAAQDMESPRDVPEPEKRRLHIDDNTSVLLQYNSEKEMADAWRTRFVPLARTREDIMIHSLIAGAYSEGFYKQFESLCDGIIDFKSQDVGGKMEHSVRIRAMRGRTFDSSWRQLRLVNSGEVVLVSHLPHRRPTSKDERRLAAVMFTDIVGYSSLTQKNERLALELLEEHRKIIRPIVTRHNGREIKTMGDAFLIEFGSALEGTECAIDIQKSFHDHNQRSIVERHIHLRIGIHLGDVLQRQSDVLGDAVNIASRIEPLAEADGICISEQVFDQVRNKVDCPIVKLGPRQFKNIDYPIDVYRILCHENHETAEVGLDKKRIAVLPFLNISPDPNDAYFADGLTEELIARLSTISGLKVIARTSVMRFRGTAKGVGEIGNELRAGTILEGSVRKATNRLRVTAQLIDASSEEHLWVQSYDRQLEDIFAIQTEVAQNVTDALKTQMLGVEREHIAKRSTGDIGAYTFYLKGRYYWNERSRDSLTKAIKYFEEAIRRDPGFALAYAGLADSYVVLVDHGHLPRSEGFPKAKEAARKALELDGTVAEAHTSLGNILSCEWDWLGAEEEFAKALSGNPNYATAHHWYSIHLGTLGRLDEGIRELKIAEELDPLSPMIHAYAGIVYFCARKYDIALAELDKALELDPNFVPAHANRVDVYLAKSMFEEALTQLERVLPFFEPLSAHMKAEVGSVYAASGRTEEAKRILRECEEASAHERAEDVNQGALALIHLKLGNKDRALEWLEKAFEARTITPFLVKLSPHFDEISSDPRFEELLKKTLRSLGAT